MKKTITLLIFTVLFNFTNFAQDYASGDLNKRIYVRGGLSTPVWQYYGFQDANALKDGLDVESRIGGIFEVGTIYMLNSINVGNHMRFGINVDFISIKVQMFNKPNNFKIYNGFAGSKIGPSFTYAPSRAIAIDAFFKLNPVWAGAIFNNGEDYENGKDAYYGYVQMMYSAGINVKLAFVMLGFEYDFGGLKLKNNDEGAYWPNLSDLNSKRTPMHGFNVTLGFCF